VTNNRPISLLCVGGRRTVGIENLRRRSLLRISCCVVTTSFYCNTLLFVFCIRSTIQYNVSDLVICLVAFVFTGFH